MRALFEAPSSAHTSLSTWSNSSFLGGCLHRTRPSDTYRWWREYPRASLSLMRSHIGSAFVAITLASKEEMIALSTMAALHCSRYLWMSATRVAWVGWYSASELSSHSSAGWKVPKYSVVVISILTLCSPRINFPSATSAEKASWRWKMVNVSRTGSLTSKCADEGVRSIALCTRYERAYVAASGSPNPRIMRASRCTMPGSSELSMSSR